MNLKKVSVFGITCFLVGMFFNLSVTHGAWKMDWKFPENGTIYNPASDEGFETIVFKGEIYDNVTGVGYFEGVLNSVVVKLTKGGKTLTKSVPTEDVTLPENKRMYIFDLNLSDSEFSSIIEGDWGVDVIFYVSEQPLAIQTSWNGTIGIDMTPPSIDFSYTPDTFTKEPVNVSISCRDNKADCLQEPVESYYAPFEFSVLGNFASLFENGIRGYSICDTVGNCTSEDTEKVNIDFFDPTAPKLETGITVARDGLAPLTGKGGFEANRMSANDKITLSFLGANDPTDAPLITQDSHACGRDLADDTYLAEDIKVSFDVVSGDNFPGAIVLRQRNSGNWRTFSFLNANGLGAYSHSGTVVEESEYKFYIRMKTGENTFENSSEISVGSVGGAGSGTLGAGTPYETQFSNFTATIEPNSQRCMAKYFVCPINHPSSGGNPQRKEMTEFSDMQTCEGLKGYNWEELPVCGFPLTFPFTLEDCE